MSEPDPGPERTTEPSTPDELKSLEAKLASLSPASSLNRDAILFEAGRAAALSQREGRSRRQLRLLTWSTAALLLLSLTTTSLWLRERSMLGRMVANPPQPEIETPAPPDEQQPTSVPVERRPESVDDVNQFTLASAPARDYLQLRNKVLEEGPDALPDRTNLEARNRQPIPSWRSGLGGI